MDLFTQFTIFLNQGCSSLNPCQWQTEDIDITIGLTETRGFDQLVRRYCDNSTYELCPNCAKGRQEIIGCLEARQITDEMLADMAALQREVHSAQQNAAVLSAAILQLS